MTSQIAQRMRDLRTTALFREIVPQESGIGWPIPFRKHKILYVTLLFFGYDRRLGETVTTLFPPLGMVTVEWRRWRIVEYTDLRFRYPWPDELAASTVGFFPHQAVSRISIDEYRLQRSELLGRYDELLAHLDAGTSIPADLEADFSRRLRLLMEPGLEPFYRTLSPKFFERFLPVQDSSGERPEQVAR